MSTDPREFEHPIDGTGGTVTAPTSPLVDVIAEILAYEHCKRVNPKADHPIMGYHTFHPDQREHLRGAQMDVARAVLAAISEAGAVEWGWEYRGLVGGEFDRRITRNWTADRALTREEAQSEVDNMNSRHPNIARLIHRNATAWTAAT